MPVGGAFSLPVVPHIEILSAETSDAAALPSLADWLRHDPDVRRQVLVTERNPGPVIDLLLGEVEAIDVVLQAYAQWRRSRWDSPAVTVRVRGVPVRLFGCGPEFAVWISALLVAEVPTGPRYR